MANMSSEMTARDITNEFNKELTSDHSHNNDKLHNHIQELKDKHLPIQYESSKNIGIKRINGLHKGSYVLLDLQTNFI